MRTNNIFTKMLRFMLQHMAYTLLILGTTGILLTYLVPAYIVAIIFASTAFSLSIAFENMRYKIIEAGCQLCRIQHNSLFDGKQRLIFENDYEDDDEDN